MHGCNWVTACRFASLPFDFTYNRERHFQPRLWLLQVRWITFHSGYDFGYLLKVLTCQPLPQSEADFFELLKVGHDVDVPFYVVLGMHISTPHRQTVVQREDPAAVTDAPFQNGVAHVPCCCRSISPQYTTSNTS